jgi:hypothetical protein
LEHQFQAEVSRPSIQEPPSSPKKRKEKKRRKGDCYNKNSFSSVSLTGTIETVFEEVAEDLHPQSVDGTPFAAHITVESAVLDQRRKLLDTLDDRRKNPRNLSVFIYSRQ